MPVTQHYTYKVTHPETGEFYFGSRSVFYGLLGKDDGYQGSGRWPKEMVFKGVKLKKEVIQVFESMADARKHERSLIISAAGNDQCRNRTGFLPLEKQKKRRTIIVRSGFIHAEDQDSAVPEGYDLVMEALKEAVKRNGNQSAAAKELGIPRQHISDLLNGKRGISENLAKLLGFRKRTIFEPVKR